MKKYVFVMNAIELLQRLVSGKRVEGVLYVDGDTGRLTFKAYNRTCLKRRAKDRLIRLLEHGWVKESAERIKVYESILFYQPVFGCKSTCPKGYRFMSEFAQSRLQSKILENSSIV